MDTKAKRLRVMNMGRMVLTLPEPDGSVDASDRHHLLGLYPPESTATLPSFGGDDLTSLNLGRLMRIGI